MPFSLESLAAIATIAGTIVSILALIHSRAWLLLISLAIAVLGIGGVLYGRRERLGRSAASNVVEGLSIDTLNLANLKQKPDRKYFIQSAEHRARITATDMELTWRYQGYSRNHDISSFDFSIESGRLLFREIDCVAYDLVHDPGRTRPIQPLLAGPESIAKRVKVPLLATLARNDRFDLEISCKLRGCLTPGIGYYSSTLCFAQRRIRHCRVLLEISRPFPEWVRVYNSAGGQSRLLKALVPTRRSHDVFEYEDVIEGIAGVSARVYMFHRGNGGTS